MLGLSNGAGTVKLVEQAQLLGRAPVSELVLGSYTMQPREGNGGRVYASGDGTVLNSLGMPNPGIGYVADHREAFLDAHPHIVVSIAGFSVDEYGELAQRVRWASTIEVNLGCPNVWDGGTQKRIGSFDPAYVADVVDAARRGAPGVQIRAKLSPFSDPFLLAEVAAAACSADALVVSNTFPNGWLPGLLDVPLAGVSGGAMKAIVLGQIKQFAAVTSQPLIGAGGVRHGRDLADYEAAGARAVQVVSRYLDGGENPDVFVTLLADRASEGEGTDG